MRIPFLVVMTLHWTLMRLAGRVRAFRAAPMVKQSAHSVQTWVRKPQGLDYDDFVSRDDRNERRPPPIMDSSIEDEGFGAYGYVPDAYDQQHFSQLERTMEEAMIPSLPSGSPEQKVDERLGSTVNDDIAKAQSKNAKEDSVVIKNHDAVVVSSDPSASTIVPQTSTATTTKEERDVSLPTSHQHAAQMDDLWVSRAARTGTGVTTPVDILEKDLLDLEQKIYEQNNDVEFNINSPKQVSEILFGKTDMSTSKSILDGMAGAGNRMADLILRYRETKRLISKQQRRRENREKGTLVKSAHTVARNGTVQSSDPLLLIDTSAYIFRAYYSMPSIHRNDGTPTGAVMGFCNMISKMALSRMVEGECPRLVLVFDAKGKTFRHELYAEYKAHRPPPPIDLIPQFDLVRRAADAFGITQIEAQNYEADDVIATLATMAIREGLDVNILSGDKDLWQLVTEEDEHPSIHMIDPMSMSRVTAREVREKWGVKPSLLGDILALAGDSADNVPGVPGIGPKIAASLIQEYGTLQNLLQNVDTIKQKGRREKLATNREQALLSRELVSLKSEVPREKMTFPAEIQSIRELRTQTFDKDKLLAFYDDMGFRDLKRRLSSLLEKRQIVRTKRSSGKPLTLEPPRPEDFSDVPF